jgi:hypothetical protein
MSESAQTPAAATDPPAAETSAGSAATSAGSKASSRRTAIVAAARLIFRALEAKYDVTVQSLTTHPEIWSAEFWLNLQRRLTDKGLYAGARRPRQLLHAGCREAARQSLSRALDADT